MASNKAALITGITGQAGSYLAEFLLGKGYVVHGIIRRSSNFNTTRIDHLYQDPHIKGVKMKLHYGDLTDANNLRRVLDEVGPQEVYNLGAQSHVRVSFDMPIHTSEVDALGTLKLLEAIREYQDYAKRTVKFYQASSSEMYGKAPQAMQNESTPFYPRSPYAVAKLYSYWMTVNYREAYGLHAGNGIAFNHESPRRGETFVTRKITRALGRIKHGLQKKLYLGNLDAKRDWGYTGDYVQAMWLMLQQEQPDDYVVATGETRSVRQFLEEAFGLQNMDYRDFVEIDKRYFRPTEVDVLCGDSTKARKKLGWTPQVTFKQLVKMMVEYDLELAAQEKTLRQAGHKLPNHVGHDH